MIEPYNAVGLIPSFWGIRRREEIKHNIEHLKGLTKAAFWLSNLDIPVRLLAIPEGALMGFNDEVLDVDHADYARTCCIDVPGPETDEIGKLARQWNVYIMAQAKARHKDWKDRFFNIGFIVDPDGKIILKHYKLSALLPVERSVSPHDLYDWWIKKIRTHARCVLARRRHQNRTSRHHDGDGRELSGKWSRSGDEWG